MLYKGGTVLSKDAYGTYVTTSVSCLERGWLGLVELGVEQKVVASAGTGSENQRPLGI